MNRNIEEMENYKNTLTDFVKTLEGQPTDGGAISKITKDFYLERTADGKKVIRQFGVPENHKEFVTSKINETLKSMEVETSKASEIVYAEYEAL